MTCSSVINSIYENSHQEISLPFYTDATLTTLADANDYVEAEYRIYSTGSCVALFSASLGSGIAIVGTTFVLTINEADIDFSGDGYTHVFRVAESAGQLQPPLFDSQLTIYPVCAVT
jgi:hypothetical protein